MAESFMNPSRQILTRVSNYAPLMGTGPARSRAVAIASRDNGAAGVIFLLVVASSFGTLLTSAVKSKTGAPIYIVAGLSCCP